VNRIGGLMVSVLASSAVDRVFEPRSGQTKDHKIVMCCFSARHAALRRKSKDLLARNQDNVSKWGGMSIRWLWFQWSSIYVTNDHEYVPLIVITSSPFPHSWLDTWFVAKVPWLLLYVEQELSILRHMVCSKSTMTVAIRGAGTVHPSGFKIQFWNQQFYF
jgi:hypothetical protein